MRKIALGMLVALVLAPAALADKPTAPGTSNSKGVKAFTAKLAGANGMKGNVVLRLGGSDGSVCWAFSNLKLNGKQAYAAHVHVKAGGAVLIPLGTATPMKRRGCTTDAALKDEIALVVAKPADYYVNVHEQAGLAVLLTGTLKKGAPTT